LGREAHKENEEEPEQWEQEEQGDPLDRKGGKGRQPIRVSPMLCEPTLRPCVQRHRSNYGVSRSFKRNSMWRSKKWID